MTPEELPALLKARGAGSPERGRSCPDEHSIAAYVDGALGTEARQQLEDHLADCSHCLALVGLVSGELEENGPAAVPEASVARARTLARPRLRRLGPLPPQWAAAATVVLAVGLLLVVAQPRHPFDSDTWSGSPATRTAQSPGPQLLSPAEGATIDGAQLTVRWSGVAGARYYEVRLLTAGGDVVSDGHVVGTEWRPPNRAMLRPGLEYFVHVDAYVSEGKAVGSEYVSFRVLN